MGMNVGTPNINQGQQQNMQQQPQRLPQQAEGQFINQLAKKLMESCTPEVRAKFQSEVNAWPDQKKQQILQQGVDPLFFRFRQHAEMLYRSGKVQIPKQQGANPMEGQQGGQPNQMQGQQPFTAAAQQVTGRLVSVIFHCDNLPRGGVFSEVEPPPVSRRGGGEGSGEAAAGYM